MFKSVYISVVTKYLGGDHAEKSWEEVERKYSKTNRYYHNPKHLESLFFELDPIKNNIDDWEIVIFAIAYHDIIYNVLRQDNEERSAEIATKRLETFGMEKERIDLCREMIVNTKTHQVSKTGDVNFFTDADLAILGKLPKEYLSYASAVRKEYKIYPDLVYKPGRAKVLEHFLAKDRIYHSDLFYSRYEIAARENLSRELDFLRKR
ncbi:HD domain-containing protein [Flavitalea antarctica]